MGLGRVAAWLVSGVAACAFAEREIYVAADAGTGGDGSRRRPYQSLEQARDAIRAARKDGSLAGGDAVTVLVGPGVYRQQAAFELNAQDSGSEGAPWSTAPRSAGRRGCTAASRWMPPPSRR
jgi:hypothetical protein